MTESTAPPTVTMQTFTPRALGLGPLLPEEIRLEMGGEPWLVGTFATVASYLINDVLAVGSPSRARLMFQPEETPNDVVIFTGDIEGFDGCRVIRFADGVALDLMVLPMQLVAVSI